MHPEATRHDAEAIADGQPAVLTYIDKSKRASKGWYDDEENCQDRLTGQQCDEYPYISTEQGGPGNGVSLKLIDGPDNMNEGAQLGGFYKFCGLAAEPEGSPDRNFLVIPIPEETMPTVYVCANGRMQ